MPSARPGGVARTRGGPEGRTRVEGSTMGSGLIQSGFGGGAAVTVLSLLGCSGVNPTQLFEVRGSADAMPEGGMDSGPRRRGRGRRRQRRDGADGVRPGDGGRRRHGGRCHRRRRGLAARGRRRGGRGRQSDPRGRRRPRPFRRGRAAGRPWAGRHAGRDGFVPPSFGRGQRGRGRHVRSGRRSPLALVRLWRRRLSNHVGPRALRSA